MHIKALFGQMPRVSLDPQADESDRVARAYLSTVAAEALELDLGFGKIKTRMA